MIHTAHGRAQITNLNVTPEAFGSAELEIEEMNLRQARAYIASRRRSGLPFRHELTVYHKRFSFSFTAIVVTLIACGLGGVLKRNTLLLSMLISLALTVVYYVLGLLTDLLAFNGYIAPAFAAWLPVLCVLGGGGLALKNFKAY